MHIDHVVYATSDLDAAADRFEARLGLPSVAGGEHRGIGTRNRIVPLGDAYVELLAAVDAGTSARTPFGAALAARLAGGDGWLAGRVRTGSIDVVARRLGLVVVPAERDGPGGVRLHWRLAGFDRALETPTLPFFIEWSAASPHPGVRPGPDGHVPSGGYGIVRVQVHGDGSGLDAWIGGTDLPVVCDDGPAAVAAVTIRTPGGDRVLR